MNPIGVLTVYQILINQCRDMRATPVKSICLYNVITPKKKKKRKKEKIYCTYVPVPKFTPEKSISQS